MLAAQMYPGLKNPFDNKGGQDGFQNNMQTPKVNPAQGGVQGVNPYGPAAPAQRAEAYEGQAIVSSIAQNKAEMAKVGLGGNPHATETLGNRLNVTEYDMF